MKTAKQAASIIRSELKKAGVKARVFISNHGVDVAVPTFESRFTPEHIRLFSQLAVDNGLTGAFNTVINPDHESLLTEKLQWSFEI